MTINKAGGVFKMCLIKIRYLVIIDSVFIYLACSLF